MEKFDVVFVGAGPASLAGAIKLAKLAKNGGKEISIAIVEKSEEVGHHILSGAIINPVAFRELFPELKDEDFPFYRQVDSESIYFLNKSGKIKIPTPPLMKNHGNFTASLSEATRWLSKKCEEMGISVFAGFPAKALLVENGKVVGIRTEEKGLDRDRQQLSNFEPSMDIGANVVVLGEGTRGHLAQAYIESQNIASDNPQVYAVGVKEIWETKEPLKEVIHTMGWPLPNDLFGGSFMYPLKDNLVAVGLVMGLHTDDAGFDPHMLMQEMKTHPLFRKYLEGGERLEWGAKTIPEGGYHSLPERLSGDGLMMVGDSVGFVNVPKLKGIHYAMTSGMLAAQAIYDAFEKNDFSAQSLSKYDNLVKDSFIISDLKVTRNMRQAFSSGLHLGMLKSGIMYFTGGKWPGKALKMHSEATHERKSVKQQDFKPDGRLTFSKVDSVHKSGNVTRDDIPSHLTGKDVPEEVVDCYVKMCPAGVYEKRDGKLVINYPNCIDCMTTDIIAPRWTTREGGSGPRYRQM